MQVSDLVEIYEILLLFELSEDLIDSCSYDESMQFSAAMTSSSHSGDLEARIIISSKRLIIGKSKNFYADLQSLIERVDSAKKFHQCDSSWNQELRLFINREEQEHFSGNDPPKTTVKYTATIKTGLREATSAAKDNEVEALWDLAYKLCVPDTPEWD